MPLGPLDLATASPETFLPHVGTFFELERERGDHLPVRLVEVEVPSSEPAGRPPKSFSLNFEDLSPEALDQGTYGVRHAQLGRFRLFVVPVGLPRDPRSYQAVIAHV